MKKKKTILEIIKELGGEDLLVSRPERKKKKNKTGEQ
tara:strand:+ start:1532 stop:1642 length:111 start_codon:yes stop_codon:yes gene_type:complete